MNLIARGDFFALMGPGGSGKRTLHENVRFPAHAFHGRETAREGMDLMHELHDFEGTAFLISTHGPANRRAL